MSIFKQVIREKLSGELGSEFWLCDSIFLLRFSCLRLFMTNLFYDQHKFSARPGSRIMREMQKSFDGLNKMACFISIFSLLKMDVLVIDEISMLSPDMLHTINRYNIAKVMRG